MLNNVKKWKRCVVASFFYLDLAQLPGELFNPKDNWKKTVSGNFTTFSIWYGYLLVLRALPDITSAPEVRKFFKIQTVRKPETHMPSSVEPY